MKPIIIIVLFTAISYANAQFVEDGVRYFDVNAPVSSRAGVLNTSFYGISDDASALLFNPAGMTISGKSEFSTGFNLFLNDNKSDFIGDISDKNHTNFTFSNLAIISHFIIGNQKGAFGLAYFRTGEFGNESDFSGYNKCNSVISYEASFRDDDNFARFLDLADSNYYTPIKDRLDMHTEIDESGGLHNLTAALAFDLNDNFSVSFAFAHEWGEFKFRRIHTETDINNYYKSYIPGNFDDIDLYRFNLKQSLTQIVSGFTGSISFMGKVSDIARYGAVIKFPKFFTVEEEFSREAWAEFDNGDASNENYSSNGWYNYEMIIPFKFALGASVNLFGLTFSSGFEYSDGTGIEFNASDSDYDDLNSEISRQLTSQFALGFGIEYEIPGIPIQIRAAYSRKTSPYSDPTVGYDNRDILGFGAGIYAAPNVRIDLLTQFSTLEEYRSVFGSSCRVRHQNTLTNFGLQLTYRYE